MNSAEIHVVDPEEAGVIKTNLDSLTAADRKNNESDNVEQLRITTQDNVAKLVQFILNHGGTVSQEVFVGLSGDSAETYLTAVTELIGIYDGLDLGDGEESPTLDWPTVLNRINKVASLEEMMWLFRAHPGFRVTSARDGQPEKSYKATGLALRVGMILSKMDDDEWDGDITKLAKKMTEASGLRDRVEELMKIRSESIHAQPHTEPESPPASVPERRSPPRLSRYRVPYISTLRGLGEPSERAITTPAQDDYYSHGAGKEYFSDMTPDRVDLLFTGQRPQWFSAQRVLDMMRLAIQAGGVDFEVEDQKYSFEEEYDQLRLLVDLWFKVAESGMLNKKRMLSFLSKKKPGGRVAIATSFDRMLPNWLGNMKTKVATDLGIKGVLADKRWSIETAKNSQVVKHDLSRLQRGNLVMVLTKSGSLYTLRVTSEYAANGYFEAELISTTSSITQGDNPPFFIPMTVVSGQTSIAIGDRDSQQGTSSIIGLTVVK